MRKLLETAPLKEEKQKPEKTGKMQQNTTELLPRLVIIGADFGGLQTTQALRKAPVQVTVIDRSNLHMLPPLLYQVTPADVFPADTSAPILRLLRNPQQMAVTLAEVTDMVGEEQHILMPNHAGLYDYLIVATGACYSYFGHDTGEPCAPGQKSMDGAVLILRKILHAFEGIERARKQELHQMLLTLVLT
jgi:NADH dehydrogenase